MSLLWWGVGAVVVMAVFFTILIRHSLKLKDAAHKNRKHT